MATRSDLSRTLALSCEFYGRTLSPAAADMLMEDLSEYRPDSVILAIKACRKELARFPTPADIIQRIEANDGRPGPEEAWAMIPSDENGSTVWTTEMSAAFGAANPHLLNGDRVAARMAFLEVYKKCVKEARDARVPPTWSVSLGNDRSTHDGALREALRRNQITLDHVQRISGTFELPDEIATPVLSIVQGATRAMPRGGE